ncbi:MAG TPA: response regulator transcription factor [Blastocatellia bacterium]|nr:response regulator transcription factor [Blastocatellia bacterium]
MTNVLIVDDSADMRRAIRLVIKDLASQIHECEDGSEVLDAYAAHAPDWVLMDIRMKKTDGLSATMLLKDRFPEARIAIVTVCADNEMKEAALALGACAYVVKDNLLELREVLRLERVA